MAETIVGGLMGVAKVVEIIGSSEKSWEDAVNQAVKRACKTVRNISGVEVVGQTAKVSNGKVVEYRTVCKIVFRVE